MSDIEILINSIEYIYDDEEIVRPDESNYEEILEFVDQLNDANTENVDPLSSPLEMTARLRNDDLNSKDRKAKFLSNAPDSNEDYFLVPRVVE